MTEISTHFKYEKDRLFPQTEEARIFSAQARLNELGFELAEDGQLIIRNKRKRKKLIHFANTFANFPKMDLDLIILTMKENEMDQFPGGYQADGSGQIWEED